MIGVAIIGYGYWGPNLARCFAETDGCRLMAVCDRSPDALARAAKRHPYVRLLSDWREALEVDYKDILWPATGERLTAETFAKYRKSDDYAIIFSIPEEAVNKALAHPQVLIGSDGIWDPVKKQGHPRCAGTYARILGKYVRQDKVLSLMDALTKMSLGPAQRLEHHAPMFKKKGR